MGHHRVVRDSPLAAYVFTPLGTDKQSVLNVILKEGGELLKKHDLFDEFTKKMADGVSKTSYAYHLVFQSFKKTLTDLEINEIMDRITEAVNREPGWRVR
ncbi:MAG: hypothetical protein HYV68_00805 [Candidatus Taylorbacteria bacterium]|nr:hypothetical protein [Candidatus Taylorbacteria bacterium]